MMDPVRVAAIAHEIERMSAEGPLTLQVAPYEAFCFVAALQLAWRHHRLSANQRRLIEHVAHKLSVAFAEYPAVLGVIAEGWNREMDA
jgi:hypothetical protein